MHSFGFITRKLRCFVYMVWGWSIILFIWTICCRTQNFVSKILTVQGMLHI